MKILFLSHQASFIYGGEICTLEMLRELKADRDVYFASPPGPYQERAKEVLGANRVHSIPSVEFNRSLSALPKFVWAYLKTARALRKLHFDIVHATSLKAMVYAAAVPGSRVWHHHNIMPNTFTNRLWQRLIGFFADAIVVPSGATARALNGISEDKINIIYNGFPIGPEPSPSAHQELVLGFIGEISRRKGADWLVKVAQALPQFKLKIIGEALSEPEFGQGILSQLKKLNAQVLGRRENIAEELKEIDLLLVPSQEDPLPTVIIEAFLAGRPVLTRRVGGIPEMLTHGVEGFFADTPEDMIAQIKNLNLAQLRTLGLNARNRARQQFSSQAMGQKLREVYDSL